jgi:hypothetical protein
VGDGRAFVRHARGELHNNDRLAPLNTTARGLQLYGAVASRR